VLLKLEKHLLAQALLVLLTQAVVVAVAVTQVTAQLVDQEL
jgi:hypothetical protein